MKLRKSDAKQRKSDAKQRRWKQRNSERAMRNCERAKRNNETAKQRHCETAKVRCETVRLRNNERAKPRKGYAEDRDFKEILIFETAEQRDGRDGLIRTPYYPDTIMLGHCFDVVYVGKAPYPHMLIQVKMST